MAFDRDALRPLVLDPIRSGGIGRGSTGMRRITSSWTTRRVTDCSHGCRLRGEEAEQHRHEAQECRWSHRSASPSRTPACSEALNNQ